LNSEDQFDTPAKIDGIISAEIPAETVLYNIVAKFIPAKATRTLAA
jgi:hypothetical protein